MMREDHMTLTQSSGGTQARGCGGHGLGWTLPEGTDELLDFDASNDRIEYAFVKAH